MRKTLQYIHHHEIPDPFFARKAYTPVNQHSNGKWTRIEDVFPIENGDMPASYVSLPGG